MEIKKVGVLGCGLMGSGIAQTAAQAGFETVVVEVEQKFLEKGMAGIEKSLGRFVEKGKMTAADRDAVQGRLKGTTKLADLADCPECSVPEMARPLDAVLAAAKPNRAGRS